MRLCLESLIFLSALLVVNPANSDEKMVHVPGGSYRAFYIQKLDKKSKSEAPLAATDVAEFLLDEAPVTNSEYLSFVRAHPTWKKSKVKRIFAEAGYLKHWKTDFQFKKKLSHKPVVNISWFAAQAYCESKDKSLPTTDQWEYALNDKGRNLQAVKERALAWYGHPNSELSEQMPANGFGIRGLVGNVWEWTLDFNDAVVTSGGNSALFCGNGSQGTTDAGDYAAFMRYSFRASLKAAFVTNNLGFRCAKEIK